MNFSFLLKLISFAMLISGFLLFGCSTYLLYESIAAYRREGCYRLPPSEVEECLDGIGANAEYQRERELLIKHELN